MGFVNFFENKVLSLHDNMPIQHWYSTQTRPPGLPIDSVFDNFSWFSQTDSDRILSSGVYQGHALEP